MTKKLRSEPSKPRPSSKLTELPSAAAHREAAQYEDDNVGVEAANRTTQAAEGGVRYAAKLSARPRPVSYTHLDVYKRQILLCFTLFKTSSMARSIFAAH